MKKNQMSVGEAIEAWLQQSGHKEKIRQTKVLAKWEELMGKPVAAQTEKLWIRDKILYVKIQSPAWKQELNLAKSKILTMMNEAAGGGLIDEVRIF